ncbi:tRNA uridine-5-carboxymethylaminomethyl(34) synthesis GTPase MnmE [Oryzomicrobium sp.]|uniref:tRNA uridine-5-carboxymethylaminomethyl(34) synthesis GTPase MnmE n=1 Tax=Oryzomicrobium sp. TaxID=1911578 RepID=UPI002FDFBBFC
MMPKRDVIAAVATAPGRGGIGVIRISGPDLGAYVAALAGRNVPPRQAVLATFRDAAGAPLDQGLLLHFPGPGSFTGEDVIELHGHGGPVVLQLLLSRCLDLGARLAEPGEFTRRAFENGKLDLAQAEAVADLIDASTASAARSAVRSLQGDFSRQIHVLNDELIELRALTEATLDFPEEEIDFLEAANAFARLDALSQRLAAIFAKARQGKLLQGGLHVVLVGQPNVGKSSLLNALAGDELAIVTPIAGTTRDVVRGTLQIEGIPLHVVDTAGLRDTEDQVEQIGIARTWKAVDEADVVLLLTDAQHGITAAEEAILTRLPAHAIRLTVENKVDLTGDAPGLVPEGQGGQRIRLSAKTGVGMAELRQALLDIAGWHPQEDVFIARERHLRALAGANLHLDAARDQAKLVPPPLELFAEELRLAQQALNSITGEFTADDLLGEIFGRFCIGK